MNCKGAVIGSDLWVWCQQIVARVGQRFLAVFFINFLGLFSLICFLSSVNRCVSLQFMWFSLTFCLLSLCLLFCSYLYIFITLWLLMLPLFWFSYDCCKPLMLLLFRLSLLRVLVSHAVLLINLFFSMLSLIILLFLLNALYLIQLFLCFFSLLSQLFMLFHYLRTILILLLLLYRLQSQLLLSLFLHFFVILLYSSTSSFFYPSYSYS